MTKAVSNRDFLKSLIQCYYGYYFCGVMAQYEQIIPWVRIQPGKHLIIKYLTSVFAS